MKSEFKKGDEVIAISSDPRNPNEKMVVESVGKLYITCFPLVGGEKMGRPIRFSKETLIREDWSCFQLYHSEEEHQNEIKRVLKAASLKRAIDNLSLEQIEDLLERINRALD